jgi:hypothetical protein
VTPQKAARVKKEPVPKKTPIKKELVTKRSPYTVKQEDRVSVPSSSPSRPRAKQEQYDAKSMRSSPYNKSAPYQNYYQPEPSLLLSGTYSISCETVSSTFNDYNLDLTLARDSSRGIWWATFR